MVLLFIGVVNMSGVCNIPHIFWVSDVINIGKRGSEFFSLNIEYRESQTDQFHINFFVKKDNVNVITGKTEPFILNPYENITITPSSFNTERFRIQDVEIETSIDTLKRIILSTGRLPQGNYILRFELVREVSSEIVAYWECPFEIVEETPVEGISPGVPFGAPLVTVNENPVFTWTGKCDSFRITIGLIVNFDLSPDEILEKYKILEKDFSKNTFMFSYPREFPPLTPGNYIWRVTGFLKTTSGINKVYSMPLCFKIEDLSSDEILRIITKKLGNNNEIIRELKEKGYKSTGSILLDSKPITIEEFKRIILKTDVKVKEARLK